MDAKNQLDNCHQLLLNTVRGISSTEADLGAVVHNWSIKEVLAHITIREHLLGEILSVFIHKDEDKPYFNHFKHNGMLGLEEFDKFHVKEKSRVIYQEIYMDYISAHDYAMDMLGKISPLTLDRPGALPWYGQDKSLNDYMEEFCEHKTEMTERIALFLKHFRETYHNAKK
jgi:hypothetical protein